MTLKKNVDQYEVHWVDPVPNQKLITLITCEVSTASRADRIMVRGELKKKCRRRPRSTSKSLKRISDCCEASATEPALLCLLGYNNG